jgi:hypothetical protein
MLLKGVLVDELSRTHEVNKDSSESWVGLEGLDVQLAEVEDIVLQGADHTVDVPIEKNAVVLHEDVFFFGSQFQVVSARVVLELRMALRCGGTRSSLGT